MKPVFQFQHTHINARDKIWTYNLNSFNISLDQLSFTSFGSVRSRTWDNEVQIRSFTELNYTPFIRKTSRTFTKFHQYFLRIPCLPIPALGFFKAKVIWTLIITVMSSTLCQLSYSLFMRVKDSHQHLLVMSQVCFLFTLTHIRLDGIRTHDGSIERAVSYHLTTNPFSPV